MYTIKNHSRDYFHPWDNSGNHSNYTGSFAELKFSIWLSVDPLADNYLSFSPYNYCAGNPILFIDPDGNSIHAVNGIVVVFMDKLKAIYGEAMGIDGKNGIYTTKSYFKTKGDYKAYMKDKGFSKREIKTGWSLYKALESKEIIEVTITITGDSPFASDKPPKDGGSTVTGSSGVGTGNHEYEEFYDLLEECGILTPELADALFNANEFIGKDKAKHNIEPDMSGEGWVYFKNHDKTLPVNGHVIIDGTSSNNLDQKVLDAIESATYYE